MEREFNLRNEGPPGTAHATRNWIHGEAVRFGEGPSPLTGFKAFEPSAPQYGADPAAKPPGDIARLGAEQQVVVEELLGCAAEEKKGLARPVGPSLAPARGRQVTLRR